MIDKLIQNALSANIIPIIAPLGLGKNDQTYNINDILYSLQTIFSCLQAWFAWAIGTSSGRIGTKILSLNKGKKRKKNENDKTVKYV